MKRNADTKIINRYGYNFPSGAKFINNETGGQILFDLSQAFGRVDRGKLRIVLYEKGYL